MAPATKPKPKKSKTLRVKPDLYATVTDRVLAALAAGTVPWRRPWAASGGGPRSMSTGKPYKGINVMLLAMSGFSSSWWGTYHQIEANGGQVRKGEKSTLIVLFRPLQRPAREGEEGDENGMVSWSTLKHFTVFNADQADWPEGLPSRFEPVDRPDFDPIDDAERIFLGYFGGAGAPMYRFGGDVACYSPFADLVSLPEPVDFESPEAFYSTAFHEMGHSTGHKTRLNRPGVVEHHNFGDELYAAEELVAEMTAAMLCAVAGVDQVQMEASAAYLDHWLGHLGSDPKLIVKAAGAAQRACEVILGPVSDEDTDEADPAPVDA